MIYKADISHDGKTVKEFLYGTLKLSGRSVTRLKKLDDGILLNGEKVTVRAVLSAGDNLCLALEDGKNEENSDIIPVSLPLDIIYEDENIVAVNKPFNMPTHPSYNHRDDTLANALAFYYKQKGKPFVFRAVNRLDSDTSGVVLVAKNRRSAALLSNQISSGQMRKKYIALCHGSLPQSNGSIIKNIKRAEEGIILRTVCDDCEGDFARTDYSLIETNGKYSLYEVSPQTGRTHQIRVHFAFMGCPLVGDYLYGISEPEIISHHTLHALSLSFSLPDTSEKITVFSSLSPDMVDAIKKCGLDYHRSETNYAEKN